MKHQFFSYRLRAYSIIEVLISLIIISILLIAALGLGRRYIIRRAWEQLFIELEVQFLQANTLALAGSSISFDITRSTQALDISELPEYRFLYFQTASGGDGGRIAYGESQAPDPNRVVLPTDDEVDQKILELVDLPLDLDHFSVKDILVVSREEAKTGETDVVTLGSSETGIKNFILSWSGPLSRLGFHKLSATLNANPGETFSLPKAFHTESSVSSRVKFCNTNPDTCTIQVVFEDLSGTQKSVYYDTKKDSWYDPV